MLHSVVGQGSYKDPSRFKSREHRPPPLNGGVSTLVCKKYLWSGIYIGVAIWGNIICHKNKRWDILHGYLYKEDAVRIIRPLPCPMLSTILLCPAPGMKNLNHSGTLGPDEALLKTAELNKSLPTNGAFLASFSCWAPRMLTARPIISQSGH